MTAVKSSLLERGVLKQDYGNNPQKLLSPENVDRAKLISYVNDTVEYATKGQLKHRDLKKDKKGNADIAVFDFTSIKKAENSARIKERKGHKLLIGLVGDSLLEPFWPTGSGCARGVLSALDAAWMVRSFALDKPPLQILSERENIYRLLSGTSSQNLQKNFDLYTISPSSRYMHIPQKKIQEVYHLFDTDDPVNADFSLGSPTGILATTKGSKKKRVSLGTKPQRRPNRKTIKFAAQSSQDSQNYSPISSSTEDLSAMSTEDKVRFAEPKHPARSRTASENLTSGGEEVHEITKTSKLAKKSRKSRSPLSSSQENQSKMKKSPFDAGLKKKSKRRKSDRASPPTGTAREEKPNKRRSIFGFGRGKNKPRKSPKTPDIPKENKRTVNETVAAEKAPKVQSSNGYTPLGEPAWTKDTAKSPFSRNHPTRRSARDIIAEMEARNKNPENTTAAKKNSVEVPRRRLVELPKAGHGEITRKTSVKRTTSELDIRTPQSKHHKKEGLWEELSSLSPSAKGAVPALSKMSPEKQRENHRHDSHDIASAMRMAGLMAMAAPLLIDEPTHNSALYTERSWFSRNNGHVKNAINKYDSLTGKKLLAKKNSKDISPLRAQYDVVDGPSSRSENRPTLVEIAKKLAANQRITSDEPQVDQPSSMDVDDGASSWQPTAIAFVEGKTGMDEMESAANEREKDHEQYEKLRRLKEDFSSLDQESTDSPVKKDFSSPIYKKTFIASVQETPKSKDKTSSKENGHNQIETPRDYAKEAEWRKSPALAKKEMERLMVALIETMSKERAEASIRFLISMFRRIQRNPREEKFRRIFKSRVKFKKYVWTVRNAKMFMFASGWIEVGSFLVFSANKNVREPLAILNKHLGLLASGSSVQISAIKSTPRRDMDPKTPRSARALPFSIPSTPRTPKTPNTGGKTDLTASVPKSNSLNRRETPVRTSGSKHTPMDKRFSKSVPLNLDSEWDLEMEDPLLQEGLSQSAVKRGRLTSSDLDVSDKTNSRGIITPKGMTSTRMPATPDVAIMEEIEGLSNTLDDLMESMEEDHSEVYNSNTNAKKGSCGQEIKDLCTTLDYMLDSSEEEELDRDLNRWRTKEDSTSEMNSPASSTSAFSKVSLRSPSSKITSTSEKFENRDKISTLSDNNLSSADLSEINVQETKQDSLENSDEKNDDIRKSDVSVPVSASTNSDFKFSIQKKEKISLKNKEEKNDETSRKIAAAAKETDNINVKEPGHYSLRPRKTNSKSVSSKNIDDAKKTNDGKKTSRRKLPNEPEKPRRPLSVGDLQMQKLASSSKSASNLPKKERPSSRNSVNSETDAQESKTRIQLKVSDDSVISKTEKSSNIRKDKPFALSKAKSKSTATLSDNTVEAKRKSSSNMASKNSSRLSLTSKSQSEINVSGKVDATTSSKTHDKQKSSSLNRKQSSSSESMSTTQKAEKTRTVPRNSGQLSEGNKKIELDSENKFKKPSVPKSRSRRPETSKTAGRSRESTSEKSLSISRLDNSVKSRPPSGLGRTRSARERKRKEIASKLDSLETSYETLEKSPNRTLNKKTSTSSMESNASSLSKKTSLTETVTEQQRSSLRKKGTVSRTSSAASRSSGTSGEDVTETTSRTRRSTSEDSVKTKRRSSAKRTPSNASLERKKMDGLLTKEEQDVLRKRSKSASEKPSSTRATKDNLEKIRLLRSKAVDIPQLRRADSSGSESLRRSGSFKAKHRRAAARSSGKSQDDTQARNSSSLEHSSKTSSKKRSPDVEQNVRSADDSFDDITVVARNCEESLVDGPAGDVGTATKKERDENENSPFSLRRKLPGDGKSMTVDSTDFISSNLNIEHQELGSQTSTPNNHEQNGAKMPEKNASEGKDIQEESDSSSLTDDTKMEFRLRNTGSWMVLDYEGLKESPKMLKKISLSSENYFDDQSPRASISSVDTPREDAEKMNGDDSVLRMEGSTAEDEDGTTVSHDKENGNIVSPGEEKLESLISNGSVVSAKDNGFVPAHRESDAHAQNGDIKPHSNGTASNGSMPPSDPPRKDALKKKTKGPNLKPKSKKRMSQSVENLTSDKNRVTFEEIQNLDVPRASTLNRSPKETKKHTFPFALRKKKTSGSCSDLNGRSPDIMVEGPSPTKTMTGSKTAPHGLIMNPEDKSFSSPHDKSYEKKKLAPFKMFKKRKSQDAST